MNNSEMFVAVEPMGTIARDKAKMRGREEESTTRQAWLDGLQKGDLAVIRFTRGVELEYYKATVDLTSSVEEDGARRIYADGSVFNNTGRWYRSHLLVEPTPEALNDVERTRLHERMLELNWKRLPVRVLAKVVALIESEAWETERTKEHSKSPSTSIPEKTK